MGVYPEPALCADDVSRIVSDGIFGSNSGQAKVQVTRTTRRADRSHSRRENGFAAALILSMTLGTSLAASATESATPSVSIDAKLRLSDSGAQWGGEPLLEQEPIRTAIVDSISTDAAKPATGTDSDTVSFGDKSLPRTLVETITRAAEQTGVEPAYLMALADKESGFDTDVRNPASSALGLFQFVNGTWLELIRDRGAKYGFVEEAAAIGRRAAVTDANMRKRILALRKDPYVSGLMAGELIKRDRAKIEGRIGREMKTTELYLAHFLGTHSAGKFLSLSAEAPRKVASSAFRNAARANRTLFVDSKSGKNRALTVAEVHERLDDMIDRRITQFGDAAKVVAQPAEPAAEKVETTVLDARLRVHDAAIPEAE